MFFISELNTPNGATDGCDLRDVAPINESSAAPLISNSMARVGSVIHAGYLPLSSVPFFLVCVRTGRAGGWGGRTDGRTSVQESAQVGVQSGMHAGWGWHNDGDGPVAAEGNRLDHGQQPQCPQTRAMAKAGTCLGDRACGLE